jgi:hypothetical protein
MPRRSTALWHRARRSAVVWSVLALVACATDSPSAILASAKGAPSSVALRASVPRTSAADGLAQVRISVSYLRVTGAPVPLGAPQLFTLGLQTQKVPVSVDVATCVADPARAGASGSAATGDECQLQIELELLLNSVRVDRQVINNVAVRPGQTATVTEPVALALVADVKIVVPAANQLGSGARAERGHSVALGVQVIDSDGRTVTGRTVRWKSSDPTVATIDANGVVSTIATGTTSLTVEVAGREVSTLMTVLLPSRTITVAADAATGSGVVRSTPAGIVCTLQAGVVTGVCAFTFPGEATVLLGATAADGSTFGAFAGDCLVTAIGACTVTEGSTARAVRASFAALRALTVSTAGDGDGTVRSATAPIDCRSTAGTPSGSCTASLTHGTNVALVAAADPGSVFIGWTGDCSNAAGCSVSMSSARAVSARFAKLRVVSVSAGPGGGRGTVTSQPAGIVCTVAPGGTSGTCTSAVPPGAVLTLTASADANSVFGGWSGTCTGTGTCAVTANEAASVVANFLARRTLSVAGAGDGAGRVASVAGAVACDIDAGSVRGVCSDQLVEGTTAQLTAVPASGSVFLGWTDGCAGTGACSVLMTGNRAVSARFARMKVVTVSARAGAGTGTVTSEPGGIACTVTEARATGNCSALFPPAANVRLSASTGASSTFLGWSGACAGTAACALTVTDNIAVAVGFGALRALAVAVTGDGRVASTPAGITCGAGGADCASQFLDGVVVQLQAIPGASSGFVGWSGDCDGASSCSVTMSANRSATARFAPLRVLTISGGASSGRGTITSTPAGIACTIDGATVSGSCSSAFLSGTAVSLVAAADRSSDFGGWSGACSGSGACDLTLTGDRTATARFTTSRQVTVRASAGTGRGTITSQPAGISCVVSDGQASGNCSAPFELGTSVSLSAAASASSVFGGWSGACQGSAECRFAVAGETSIGAGFNGPRALSVAVSGDGRVSSSPAGISCGTGATACAAQFTDGSVVQLQAVPGASSAFIGWSGDCGGGSTCAVTMTANRSATARFAPFRQVSISAGVGGGRGTISSSPGGINCTIDGGVAQGSCSGTFPSGTEISLSASPASGSNFGGWGGACIGTSSCSFTLVNGASVSASFVGQQRTLSVSVSGEGSGSITGSPGSINCRRQDGTSSGVCSDEFSDGAVVQLNANPGSGSSFTGWSGDCVGTGSCAVSMNRARSVSATFGGSRLVTVVAGSTGRGTVSSSPAGINCVMNGGTTSGTCSALLTGQVTLSANASNGSTFASWSGPCSGTGDCTFTPVGATTVAASFARPVFTLAIDVSGTLGSVSSSLGTCAMPAMNVGASCSYRVTEGEIVSLSPSPGPLQVFENWSGFCAGTGQCSFVMGGDRSVGARFLTGPSTITVSGSGTGVVVLGGAIRCIITGGANSGTCSIVVPRGQSITLGIDPTASFPFLGWGGACAASGTARSCTLTPSSGGTVDVTARFASPVVRD